MHDDDGAVVFVDERVEVIAEEAAHVLLRVRLAADVGERRVDPEQINLVLFEQRRDDLRAKLGRRAAVFARHEHALLLPRIWQLRGSLTAYDATYVALADALGATLVTRDASLARVAGPSRVTLLD